MNDPTALKPVVGEPQLSHKAIEMRSQRMFKRRANGSLKVSEVVFKEWHEKGARRTLLETIFRQATFISEVDVMRQQMIESEVVIEGEFASVETMQEWGFTEQRIEAIKAHCRSNPRQLMRDTYESITLYYVERSIKGSLRRKATLSMTKSAKWQEEGADGFDLNDDPTALVDPEQ
ncbi:unnamed protein product, partial [Symbiodinium necroappetens]